MSFFLLGEETLRVLSYSVSPQLATPVFNSHQRIMAATMVIVVLMVMFISLILSALIPWKSSTGKYLLLSAWTLGELF